MKETVRSLRWYFGIIGALGVATLLLSVPAAFARPGIWLWLDACFFFAVSVITLYAAFTLPKLLRVRPGLLVTVNKLCQVRWIIGFLVVMSGRPSPVQALGSCILFISGLALLRYLQRNLLRLAAESAAPGRR